MKPFEEHVIGLKSKLYQFAFSLTLDKEKANDLTQDTILKLLKSQSVYQERDNLKGWAYTIMKNIFINDYRKSIKYKKVDNAYLAIDNLGISSSFDPEVMIDAKDINEAIKGLPIELCNTFKMYIAGYSYQEISEKLDIPLGTVKSRIFGVRNKLKALLKSMYV